MSARKHLPTFRNVSVSSSQTEWLTLKMRPLQTFKRPVTLPFDSTPSTPLQTVFVKSSNMSAQPQGSEPQIQKLKTPRVHPLFTSNVLPPELCPHICLHDIVWRVTWTHKRRVVTNTYKGKS